MEIEGHPTQDLIEELERRGGLRMEGTSLGPHVETVRLIGERVGEVPGTWLFLPRETFATGFDEIPH